jgi:hypothetical protein
MNPIPKQRAFEVHKSSFSVYSFISAAVEKYNSELEFKRSSMNENQQQKQSSYMNIFLKISFYYFLSLLFAMTHESFLMSDIYLCDIDKE